MSQAVSATEQNSNRPIGDALAAGIAVMLIINVLQRVVGLARNLGFSLFLAEDQLGLWSMANSFFVIAPPFIVLGLPGSFGKFVEHYRQHGNLKSYLRQVALVCTLALVVASTIMLIKHDWAAKLLYGQTQPISVISWTVISLIVLTLHNFLNEIVLSLRQVRLGSVMQFVNSFAFCVLGVSGIYYFQTWTVLLPSFAIAYLLAMIPGLYGLSVLRAELSQTTHSVGNTNIWKRIVPFAIALWTTNLLTNTFELSDRFMLLHFSGDSVLVGQAYVGQFYCGRIIPNLLLSLAMMLSGIYLPYLSADWEQKQFTRISTGMNNTLVMMCVGFTGLSIGALSVAPFLFKFLLAGRFGPAQDIMPLGMMQATWSGITMIASTYLFCAEKGRQTALMLAVGLAMNISLNWPLIQWLGLYGAALATTSSNAVLFLLICWRLNSEGCPIRRRTILLCSLPICLIVGVYFAAAVFAVLAIICSRTNWILQDVDRAAIDGWIIPRLQKAGLKVQTIW